MKKLFIIIALAAMSMPASAQETIKLPAPNKNVEMTLFSALQQRKSVREYADKDVDQQTLSQVLWAACGVNRPDDQLITAPSAMNRQDVVVFACTKDGAYRYEPIENELVKVSGKDLRASVAGPQRGVASAPVFLLLVSDQSRFGGHGPGATFGAMDTGYVSQNIYLACTSLGLGTVARYGMDRDALKKELGLADSMTLELNHPIGWLK